MASLRRLASIAITVILSAIAFAVCAQDYAREKRWADEITPAIVVGDPVWLELGGGHRFLNLFAEAGSAKAAIVLVHGVGVHPDHGVIGILRSKLYDMGYTTLAVQMPVSKGEGASVEDYYPALFPQAGERIATATRFLQSKGYRNIILVSHSMGAWMSNVYLADIIDAPFRAWVSMGLTGRFWNASLISIPWFDIEWFQGRLRLPILDIYGEKDLAPTLAGARSRANALVHIPRSEQTMIAGADHHYTGKETDLANAIHRFVTRILE